MLLSYIFTQLTQGEASQLALAGTDFIGIQPTDYEKVIPHVNLALTELYKRFSLKTRELTIQEHAEIPHYYLNDDFAVSNTASTEDPKYIIDTAEDPFTNDVLRIQSITDEEDEPVGLNDYNDENSIITLSPELLRVPSASDTGVLTIMYRAAPDVIPADETLDPEEYDVALPVYLLEALILYTFHRMLSSDPELSNNLLLKFEASCNKVLELDLLMTDETTNMKLENNGWV